MKSKFIAVANEKFKQIAPIIFVIIFIASVVYGIITGASIVSDYTEGFNFEAFFLSTLLFYLCTSAGVLFFVWLVLVIGLGIVAGSKEITQKDIDQEKIIREKNVEKENKNVESGKNRKNRMKNDGVTYKKRAEGTESSGADNLPRFFLCRV